MLIFRATKFVQLRLTTNDPTIVFVAQRSPKNGVLWAQFLLVDYEKIEIDIQISVKTRRIFVIFRNNNPTKSDKKCFNRKL